MKNGSPNRYCLPKSKAVSGSGRFWPVMFGPVYGRGRSSRASWKRNSLRNDAEKLERAEPVTDLERSALRSAAESILASCEIADGYMVAETTPHGENSETVAS